MTELSSKTEENEKLKQSNIELGIKVESNKHNARELQDQLIRDMDYKKMYHDFKTKVYEYTNSTKKTNSDSPLRTIDEQKDNI